MTMLAEQADRVIGGDTHRDTLAAAAVSPIGAILATTSPRQAVTVIALTSRLVGDAMGILPVTPVLLILRRARWPLSFARWGEVLVLVVCAAVLLPVATRISLRFLFLIYPLVIWAALWLQLAGSTVCALFASVMAITVATEGIGPFAHHTRVSALILL